jgi:hypothetical protein
LATAVAADGWEWKGTGLKDRMHNWAGWVVDRYRLWETDRYSSEGHIPCHPCQGRPLSLALWGDPFSLLYLEPDLNFVSPSFSRHRAKEVILPGSQRKEMKKEIGVGNHHFR